MAALLIRNGRILDPKEGRDETADLLIVDGRIADASGFIPGGDDRVIDAEECWVMPGLIDLHVHLRDPGQTEKEDIRTGSLSAAAGGFTTIVAMPNTRPVIDTPDRMNYVLHKAAQVAPIHVLQAGAVTQGEKGEQLSDLEGMIRAGVPAVSEDGRSVMNAALCRRAMEILARADIPFLDHCEDADLVKDGCVNADSIQEAEGLPGITNAVEDVITARDILLAKETGAKLHLCHCSTKGSAILLREAKKQGVRVTGEVCPHHFTLTSADRIPGDTNYKMNPPLRTAEDREALRNGLADGTFDVISTDHAPHTAVEKGLGMKLSPFGIVGLETAVPLTITELVETGLLTPLQMAEKMSGNPAEILGLRDRGTLRAGAEGDVVIIDPKEEYRIDATAFFSKGRNTPFHRRIVRGRVRATICGGRVVYEGETI